MAVKVVSCSCCQELLNCEIAMRKLMKVRLCYCNDILSINIISKFFFTCYVARSSTNSSSRGSGSHCKTEGEEDSVETKASGESGLEDEETGKIQCYFCNVKEKFCCPMFMITIEHNGSLIRMHTKAEYSHNRALIFLGKRKIPT